MFEIEVSRAARRYLERLDKPTRQRIADAIDELGRNPYEGDVRRLEGDPHLFRKRVGFPDSLPREPFSPVCPCGRDPSQG